ncbi:hypothetical protein CSKR_101607 [Clonorchis sinensis]|uniref:Uncharacterized protein n=1 Tax=Clonorchis sinensis TaxID=79923 RepID=A0A419Q6C7_CLOSI|nr:hypothetical protein CSKR_101607 [Clonorchis sinensis]
MCCTRPPHVPVATIFEISRYMYRLNALLIRLLKILRQPTTGLAIFRDLRLGDCETGCGLSKNFQQPYEYSGLVKNLFFLSYEGCGMRNSSTKTKQFAEEGIRSGSGYISPTFWSQLRGVMCVTWVCFACYQRKTRCCVLSFSIPTSASRLSLSRLGKPGSIPALVLPSGGMAARHRKGATGEQFFSLRGA